MLQTIIMHGIAALIWILALGMAAVWSRYENEANDKKAASSAMVLLFLAVAAFTLQVLA
jgi:hypothetical protein